MSVNGAYPDAIPAWRIDIMAANCDGEGIRFEVDHSGETCGVSSIAFSPDSEEVVVEKYICQWWDTETLAALLEDVVHMIRRRRVNP